jgi:hypothetical protein
MRRCQNLAEFVCPSAYSEEFNVVNIQDRHHGLSPSLDLLCDMVLNPVQYPE